MLKFADKFICVPYLQVKFDYEEEIIREIIIFINWDIHEHVL